MSSLPWRMGSAGTESEGQRSCSHAGRGKERMLWEEEEGGARGKRGKWGCEDRRRASEEEREGGGNEKWGGEKEREIERREEKRASKRERPFPFLHMQYSSAP